MRNLDLSGSLGLSISSENTGAGMSKTYSARGCGWLRLRGSIATKTKKSGSMLKARIGREQLVFASDNLSANPNACSRISSFCKPFRSHLRHPHPRAESVFEKALRCFLEILKSEGSRQMQISKEGRCSFTLSTTGEVYGYCGGMEALFCR